jgi:hypothetical protein
MVGSYKILVSGEQRYTGRGALKALPYPCCRMSAMELPCGVRINVLSQGHVALLKIFISVAIRFIHMDYMD